MLSLAVFVFLFWKSVIAWRAIFVYFPLVGISVDSVRPLYSIFVSYLVVVIWYLCFVELSFNCHKVYAGIGDSCGRALAIIE